MDARDNGPPDIYSYEFYSSEMFHSERNHQGVGNRLLEPPGKVGSTNDPIHCRERLGGMLNYYYREAA
jgi:hypothetical protein